MNVERSYVEELIDWELRRQTTWAIMTIIPFIGIIFTIRALKDYGSTHARVLFSLFYFVSAFFLEFCVLKLFWSYQTIRMYENVLGNISGIKDSLQNLLFTSYGTMKIEGIIIINGAMGFMTALLFQFFYLIFLEKSRARKLEEEPVLERARLFLEEKREGVNPKVSQGTRAKGIGPKFSTKLREAGINDIRKLAKSKPEEIAKILGISDRRASDLIAQALAILKNNKNTRNAD
jgi:predicted flap endonuclease-1-like 5' DNA nuclease